MIKFFQAIASGGTVNPFPNDFISGLIIGDSIGSGTSNGAGSATANSFYEFNGTSTVLIAEGGEALEANTGSPYPAMADRFFTQTSKPFYLVETAVGGSEFAPYLDTNNWSTSGTRYAIMITKASNYLTEQSISKFDFIRITLGINDARGTTLLATVESDAISLISRLRISFPNTPIFINQLGRSSANATRVSTIRGYINDLVTNNTFVYAAKDLNEFDASLFYDGLHLNQSGNDQLGIADANIILNTI
jgi:hypothetical protein